jgi:hypothetical protein
MSVASEDTSGTRPATIAHASLEYIMEKQLSELAHGWTVRQGNVKKETRSRQGNYTFMYNFSLSLLVCVSEETQWDEECEEWRADDGCGGRYEGREAEDDEVDDVFCRGTQYCGSECPMDVVLCVARYSTPAQLAPASASIIRMLRRSP